MKKFLLAIFMSTGAFAGELLVMDIPAQDVRSADRIDSRFVVNEEMGTVSAQLRASRTYVQCTGPIGGGHYGPHGRYGHPRRHCMTYERIILSMTEEIPGMTVVDKIVSIDGTVCGKMGLSRIFKVPTFFLSGSCKLSEKFVRENGERKLQVKLITK